MLAGDAVDIQQACVQEAAILQGPVSALKGRLHQLLQEWPEHPVLVQLLAICHRLTGIHTNPVSSSVGAFSVCLEASCKGYAGCDLLGRP